MQDIKIRRPMQSRPQPQHQKPVTVRETEKIVREVFQPPQTLEKPRSKFAGSWRKLMSVALVVVLAATVVSFVMKRLNFLVRPRVPAQEVVQQPQVKQQPLFYSSAFYGVRMTDETLYFARVTEAAQEHYVLRDVFYEKAVVINVTSTATTLDEFEDRSDMSNMSYTSDKADMSNRTDGSNKITLVKFGTEEYQPEDELFVPREKVKEIFPLQETSAILKAIREYLKPE